MTCSRRSKVQTLLQQAGERNFSTSYSRNRWEVINPSPVQQCISSIVLTVLGCDGTSVSGWCYTIWILGRLLCRGIRVRYRVGLDDIALPVTRMHNTWCVSPVMSCLPAPAAFGHDLLFRAFYPNRRSYSPLHCQTDLFQRPPSSRRRAIPPLSIWGAFVTSTDATEEVGAEGEGCGLLTMQSGELVWEKGIFQNFGSERSDT